ncbi:MAG TPA: glycosyltransferase family 2 protein [Gammaproteobacteria bacterium]|nr:glycosyltransferase family 2 protein [Gammaproteobacteria bacterium]
MEWIFWICLAGVVYAYFGYPLLLLLVNGLLARLRPARPARFQPGEAPPVTLLIPAHNEAAVIGNKLENCLALEYPGELEVLVVSDGSSDATVDIVQQYGRRDSRLRLIVLEERKGKANALNVGLEQARGEILVFSDASILLDPGAVWEIVRPFADPRIGCVSGEDHIEGGGGEGLYGRYELFLRNQESRYGSIVGASGSFYAQRRGLVTPFLEGFAPDFLSVLNTVEQGYRAISLPEAFGFMRALSSTRDEFQRKVRTLIRGYTALFRKASLLNPLRAPLFAFFLFSHKLMRWLVPLFLLGLLMSNLFLLDRPFYLFTFVAQLLFYGAAFLAWRGVARVEANPLGRIALYFTAVNLAILVAWLRYLRGVRQEIWTPSKRVPGGGETP